MVSLLICIIYTECYFAWSRFLLLSSYIACQVTPDPAEGVMKIHHNMASKAIIRLMLNIIIALKFYVTFFLLSTSLRSNPNKILICAWCRKSYYKYKLFIDLLQ